MVATTKKKVYSARKKAMTIGWSHRTDLSKIPQIWGYFAEAEDVEEQRADLHEAMDAWS